MSLLWKLLGLAAILLFFAAVTLFALAIRFRRGKALLGSAVILTLSYIVLQSVILYIWRKDTAQGIDGFAGFFTAGNGLLPLALCLGMASGTWLLGRGFKRVAASRITPSSIKEATDTLPSGICFFRDDGRVLLVNRAMEDLCRRLTGEALVNGRMFYETLSGGKLSEGCQRAGSPEEPLIVLPDGAAWSFSLKRAQDDQLRAELLVAADVTEIYDKTRTLNRTREEVTALNHRLTVFNREIVDLTAAREILNAKVKIHDELGGNLLAIRRYLLEGGSPADRAEIAERLRLNIAFLKSGQMALRRDEYALMLETARTLGVNVHVEGRMPQWEPARHILTVAIHECFTNTLRHAHGSTLYMHIDETEARVTAGFSNDGEPPGGPIRERGGLGSLRALAEGAGGTMRVRTSPDFSITLELPKEDEDAFPSHDRG